MTRVTIPAAETSRCHLGWQPVRGRITRGLLSGLPNSGGSDSERVQFERIHGEFVIPIRTALEEAVESVVTVTDDSGSAEEARRPLDAGITAEVVDPFDGGSAPYTVTVAVEGKGIEEEMTLRPSETPENEFVYRITPDGITVRNGYRPAADVVTSNDREDAVDVRAEVDDPPEH